MYILIGKNYRTGQVKINDQVFESFEDAEFFSKVFSNVHKDVKYGVYEISRTSASLAPVECSKALK